MLITLNDAKEVIKSYNQNESIDIEVDLPDLLELVDTDKEKFLLECLEDEIAKGI